MTDIFAGTPQMHLSGLRQWYVLTARIVRVMATKGELIVAVVTSLVLTYGYYLPLRLAMQIGGKLDGLSYAQFVMPVATLQAMSFTMMSIAQLAAMEAMTGFNSRLQTMPVAEAAPVAARISAGLVRSVVSLIATLCFGHLIGFRFLAGTGPAVGFCAFALAVGTVLSLGADALGNLTKNPESLSQALTLPILIFGMLSCGFVPEGNFPEWIRPFVRNQPISQFSYAMRDMATYGVYWEDLWPALAWLTGLAAVFTPVALWASRRRG